MLSGLAGRAVPKASREDDEVLHPLLCGSTKTRRRADTYDDRRVNSALLQKGLSVTVGAAVTNFVLLMMVNIDDRY